MNSKELGLSVALNPAECDNVDPPIPSCCAEEAVNSAKTEEAPAVPVSTPVAEGSISLLIFTYSYDVNVYLVTVGFWRR